jgi:hypothetical protein
MLVSSLTRDDYVRRCERWVIDFKRKNGFVPPHAARPEEKMASFRHKAPA